MIPRLQKLSKINSLFLFGARGTGKSTLLTEMFTHDPKTLWINLLTSRDESIYARNPDELSRVLQLQNYERVIIDEVQKAPKILDIVHLELEQKKAPQFILTGSSARKLIRGASNLLAGRAFTYHLFPLTHLELEDKFDLTRALSYGTLPQTVKYQDESDLIEYLKSYVFTYLKEEIQVEQLVRQINPFRDFLEIAAQHNGEILNASAIARDIRVDPKTVVSYFQILEDTLLGFHLGPFHRSIRKRQLTSPKFYFFDTGVVRALQGQLSTTLNPKTYAFGKAFEHWVLLECFRMNNYFRKDFRFSYLKTKDGAEIDLVIEMPGTHPPNELLLEIKSCTHATDEQVKSLVHFQESWDRPVKSMLLSLDPSSKIIRGVECHHWIQGLKLLFT